MPSPCRRTISIDSDVLNETSVYFRSVVRALAFRIILRFVKVHPIHRYLDAILVHRSRVLVPTGSHAPCEFGRICNGSRGAFRPVIPVGDSDPVSDRKIHDASLSRLIYATEMGGASI
jgi:hypothetical protein